MEVTVQDLNATQQDALRGVVWRDRHGKPTLCDVEQTIVVCHGQTGQALVRRGLATAKRKTVRKEVYERDLKTRHFTEYRLTQAGLALRKELRS